MTQITFVTDPPRHNAWVSGRFYYPPYANGSQGALSYSTGQANHSPIWLPGGVTFDRIFCEITTVAAAGGKIRMGAWPTVNGLPGSTPALDSGSLASDAATGILNFTISWTPARGVYWIAPVCQVASTTLRVMRLHPGTFPQISQTTGDIWGLRDLSQTTTDVALVTTGALSADRMTPIVGLRAA